MSYDFVSFQMSDLFDNLDADFDLFGGFPPQSGCEDHLAHDGRCIFALSRGELLRCLYRRKAFNVPSCYLCSSWPDKEFKNFRRRLQTVVKNYISAPCYSPTLATLLKEMQTRHGKPPQETGQSSIPAPAPMPRSLPSATVTSAGATSAPPQHFPPSGPPQFSGHPRPCAPPSAAFPQFPMFYGYPPSYMPSPYPGFSAPPPPSFADVAQQDSSSESVEEDEPPAKFILTDLAKKWVPDMVQDTDVKNDDPQSCAFGFEDSAPQSSFGQVEADDGLCGAFLRGVNYHLKTPSQHMQALLDSLPTSELGLPRCEFSPLPVGAYTFKEHASKMPSFLSQAALRSQQSHFSGWSPPSIPRDLSSRWSSISRGFLYLHEMSSLTSLLMAGPGMDLEDRQTALRQMRKMLLGAAFTMGSLGHNTMMSARQLHIKVMGEHASPTFNADPFGLSSPLGPSGSRLWNSGPSDLAQARDFIKSHVAATPKQSSGRLQKRKNKSQQKPRFGPFKRPKNLPAQKPPSNQSDKPKQSHQKSQRGGHKGGHGSKKSF